MYFFTNRGFTLDESRDLAQETFLGVHRSLDRFRRDSSLETWLFRIAANIWRNAVRSRSVHKRQGLEVSLDGLSDAGDEIASEPETDGTQALIDNERAQLLRREVTDLPVQMRRCLLLRLDQDMKYREIAAVLGISIETVKSQLFQARERLRENLKEHFPELEP